MVSPALQVRTRPCNRTLTSGCTDPGIQATCRSIRLSQTPSSPRARRERRPSSCFTNHLYLVAGMIRSQLPDITLQHFIHIPWPDPGYWHLLPPHMRTAIFEGLCANDIVGLQTQRSAQNFLNGCHAYLPDAEIGWGTSTIFWHGEKCGSALIPSQSMSRVCAKRSSRSSSRRRAPACVSVRGSTQSFGRIVWSRLRTLSADLRRSTFYCSADVI